MKIFILGLILGLIVVGLVYSNNIQPENKQSPTINLLDICPNFSFEKFIKTGGSKIITNNNEQLNELMRLNYICN